MLVRLRPEARQVIYDASQFYDRQSAGLGDQFVKSILKILNDWSHWLESIPSVVLITESYPKSSLS